MQTINQHKQRLHKDRYRLRNPDRIIPEKRLQNCCDEKAERVLAIPMDRLKRRGRQNYCRTKCVLDFKGAAHRIPGRCDRGVFSFGMCDVLLTENKDHFERFPNLKGKVMTPKEFCQEYKPAFLA